MPDTYERAPAQFPMEQTGVTEQEVALRKQFLQFVEEDIQRLVALNPLAKQYAEPVIRDFYKFLLSFEEGRRFFKDPAVLERVQRAQKAYFLSLTEGIYDRAYIENRIHIGAIHERIGLPIHLYLGMYNWYLRDVTTRIFKEFKSDAAKALETVLSLTKIIFLDLGLAMETYTRTISFQQQAIRTLSTPVLPVRDRLLVVPLIGILDSARALQLTEQLLAAIRTYRAKAVVMDITGVAAVDSKVANHLLQTVEAARLMGASVVVTGLSSEIAQTLVRIGVDLSRLRTMTDLRAGLEEAEAMLGYRVVKEGETQPNSNHSLA